MGLTWGQIGAQLNVSLQRAQQLYSLNKFFQRSAKSPFRDLSTRARNLLNNVASDQRWPRDWESRPELVTQMLALLRSITPKDLKKFRQAGKQTTGEVNDFLTRHVTEAFGGEVDAKTFTTAEDPQEAVQVVTKFLNENGFMGEFTMWPPGTLKNLEPEYEFAVGMSNFMSDAFEERWSAFAELDAVMRSMGYEYDVAGEPGHHRFLNFFKIRG